MENNINIGHPIIKQERKIIDKLNLLTTAEKNSIDAGDLLFLVKKDSMYTAYHDKLLHEVKYQIVPNMYTINKYNINKDKKGKDFTPDKDLDYSHIKFNNTLGLARTKYVAKQNWEILLDIKEALDLKEINIHRCGHFEGGKKIYFEINIPESWKKENEIIGVNNYDVNEYKYRIFAISSHDGSTRLAFGIINQVIACQNMFYTLIHGKSSIKFKHTSSIINTDNKLCGQLKSILLTAMMSTNKLFNQWKKEKITSDYLIDFVKSLTKVRQDRDFNWNRENYPGMKKKTFDKATSIHNRLTEEIRRCGLNKWGAFNGITKYTTHYLGPIKRKGNNAANNYSATTEQLSMGSGAKLSYDAIEYLIANN